MLPKSASSYLRVIKDWHYIVTTLTPPGQFLTPFLLFDGKEKNLKDMPSLSSASRSDRESLIFRYRIPLSACADFPRNRLPLSAFAALFDEISTWAIVGAERNRSMRPGVSTYLSAHLGQGGLDGLGQELGDTIDFEVDVIKVGRTMAFANISAIDLESGAVICTGRHTKYLPMGLFYETMFHKKVLPVTKAYVRYVNQGVNPYLSLDSVKKTLHDTVEFDAISPDNKKGKILVKANKCNAYGTLHGGCQAILAEQMGMHMARTALSSENPTLKSIHMSYFSSERNSATLSVDKINGSAHDLTQRVALHKADRGSPISEAILEWIY